MNMEIYPIKNIYNFQDISQQVFINENITFTTFNKYLFRYKRFNQLDLSADNFHIRKLNTSSRQEIIENKYNIDSTNYNSCNYFANFDGSKFITENNSFNNSKLNFNNYYLNQSSLNYNYNTFDISLTPTDKNILKYGKIKK